MRALLGPLSREDPRGVLLDLDGLDIRSFGPDDADIRYDPARAPLEALWARLPAGWTPDLLVWWTAEYSYVPEGIERCPVPSIAVLGDWNLGIWTTAPLLEAFDLVVTDAEGVRRLGPQLGVPVERWPAFSFHPQLHQRRASPPRDIDVLFVGSLNFHVQVERAAWLGRLAALGEGCRVHVTGSARGADYAALLNRARIVWNRSIRGELNMRAYEATACGALLFMEAENLEVRDTFTPGESCVLYTARDLESLLAYYLERPALLDRVAEGGWRRVQDESHRHHLARLLGRARGLGRGPRPFGDLPPWRRDYWLGLHALTQADPLRVEAAFAHFLRAARTAADGAAVTAALGATAALGVINRAADPEVPALLRTARGMLEAALAAAPEDVVTLMNLAWVLRATRDRAGAGRAWQAALDRLGGAPAPVDRFPLPFGFDRFRTEWERAAVEADATARGHAFARLLEARAAGELAALDPEPAAALPLWSRSVAASPDVDHNRRRQAEALAAAGRTGEARALLATVLAANPFEWAARAQTARLAFQDGDLGQVAELLAGGERLARVSPEARVTMGRIDPDGLLHQPVPVAEPA